MQNLQFVAAMNMQSRYWTVLLSMLFFNIVHCSAKWKMQTKASTKLQKKSVIVATYNLWNVMFHWEVRKYYIANMLNTLQPDIIGFQEVRAHQGSFYSQLHDLQQLSPQYKYLVYEPINLIVSHAGHQPPGWEYEGIGILSMHPIIYKNRINLTLGIGSDRNQRAMLNVQVQIQDEELSLSVIHFSYDKQQQCKNSADVLDYFYSAGLERSIILGDFNVYNTFPWPIMAVISGQFSDEAPDFCGQRRYFSPPAFKEFNYNFIDAWQKNEDMGNGSTYSNMPLPGLVSRPDRILVSKTGFKVEKCWTEGNRHEYKINYKTILWLARLRALIITAFDNLRNVNYDRSCVWDCGPHAACRCGICVKGDEKNTCSNKDCTECDGEHVLIVLSVLAILFFGIFYIVCCASWIFMHRGRLSVKAKRSFLGNKVFLAIVTLFLVLTLQLSTIKLNDTFLALDAQLEEEFSPSDHLLVASEIAFSYR